MLGHFRIALGSLRDHWGYFGKVVLVTVESCVQSFEDQGGITLGAVSRLFEITLG